MQQSLPFETSFVGQSIDQGVGGDVNAISKLQPPNPGGPVGVLARCV